MGIFHARKHKGLWAMAITMAAPVLGYVMLTPQLAWPLYQNLLFTPSHQAPNTERDKEVISRLYHARLSEIKLTAKDGSAIHARYFELPGTDRVFLASEGAGGNIYRRINHARFLLQCGGSVLQYDYRGFGDSEGKVSIEGACDDACTAYDYLINEKHKKAEDIIAFGESFGTGVSGQLCTRRKLAGVILHSGYSSLLRAGRDRYAWLRLYPDSFFPRQVLDNIAVFSKPHPPLLIMHGGKDLILSQQNATDLYAAAPQPKMLITVPEGGHSFFNAKLQNGVIDYLAKNKL